MKKGILMLFIIQLFGCASHDELATVKDFDVNKYVGTWYEIARLPNSFEKKLTHVTATYSIKENGKINVLNRGFDTTSSKWKDIEGTATIPNKKQPAQLAVQFFWPFKGNYYVMYVDEAYQVALVGDPSRKFLWILSKQKTMKEDTFLHLQELAKNEGFLVNRMIQVNQE